MKFSVILTSLSLGMAASGAVLAQSDETKTPLSQFVTCPDRFECADRSTPVTSKPEDIIHPLSREINERMVYRVGLKPQFVLVAEHRTYVSKPVRELAPTPVLVQPKDKDASWMYVTPK
jgi:hypothetical protein